MADMAGLAVWGGAPAYTKPPTDADTKLRRAKQDLLRGASSTTVHIDVPTGQAPGLHVRVAVLGNAEWADGTSTTPQVQLLVLGHGASGPVALTLQQISLALLTLSPETAAALGGVLWAWMRLHHPAALLGTSNAYVAWTQRPCSTITAASLAWPLDRSEPACAGAWLGTAPTGVHKDRSAQGSPWAVATVVFQGKAIVKDGMLSDMPSVDKDDTKEDTVGAAAFVDDAPSDVDTASETTVRTHRGLAFTRKAPLGGWVTEALPRVLQAGGQHAPTTFFLDNRNIVCLDERSHSIPLRDGRTHVVSHDTLVRAGKEVAHLLRDVWKADNVLPPGGDAIRKRLTSPWWLAKASQRLLQFAAAWDRRVGSSGPGVPMESIENVGLSLAVHGTQARTRPVDSVRAFCLGLHHNLYACAHAQSATAQAWLKAIPGLVGCLSAIVVFVTTTCRAGGAEWVRALPPVHTEDAWDAPRPLSGADAVAVTRAVHCHVLVNLEKEGVLAEAIEDDAFVPWRLGVFEGVPQLVASRGVFVRQGIAYGTLDDARQLYCNTMQRWTAEIVRWCKHDLITRLKVVQSTLGGPTVRQRHVRLGIPPVDTQHNPLDSAHRHVLAALLVGTDHHQIVPFPLPIFLDTARRPSGGNGHAEETRTQSRWALPSVPEWLQTQLNDSRRGDTAAVKSVLARVDQDVRNALCSAPPCITKLALLAADPARKPGARHPINLGRITLTAFFLRMWNIRPARWAPLLEAGFLADGYSPAAFQRLVQGMDKAVRDKQVYSYSCDKLRDNKLCPVAAPADMEDLGTFLHASARSVGSAWHNRGGLTTNDGRTATHTTQQAQGFRAACSWVMLHDTTVPARTREGQAGACVRKHIRIANPAKHTPLNLQTARPDDLADSGSEDSEDSDDTC